MKWLLLVLNASVSVFAHGAFECLSPSTPDEIASLGSELLIDGVVSAMSGQLTLSEEDLRVRAAQDLVLQ